MRRLVIVIAITALAGVALATWGGAASAREAGPSVAFAADQAKLPPLPADIKARKRWNIAVKCDSATVRIHRATEQERRLRRRDRTLVRALRVRQGEPRHLDVHQHRGPRARADDGTRRPGHRDVHVQHGSRDAHRLLAGVLQGDRAPARLQQLVGPLAQRPGREDDRDDERIGLRPLGQELLQGHEVHRHGRLLECTDRLPRRACRRADVRRHRAARHRRDRSQLQADERPVPRPAVRHRDQAGQRRLEEMGRLAARAHAQAGSLLPDPEEHRASGAGRALLEEHPAGRSRRSRYNKDDITTVCP